MKNLKPFDILFMGSDGFSIGVLKMLIKSPDVWNSISIVVPSQKYHGTRMNQLYTPELQTFAEQKRLDWTSVPKKGIKAFIPPEQFLSPLPTSLLVTASFGSILPPSLLSIFDPSRQLNVHPSLLPKYRGASPIQTALMNNDTVTGVTILGMSAKGTDRGDIWAQTEVPIKPESTYHSLLPPLAEEGGVLLIKTLRQLLSTSPTSSPPTPTPQSASPYQPPSTAPKIRHSLARIDFRVQTAPQIATLYRSIGHQQNLTTSLPPISPTHPKHHAAVDMNLYGVSLPPQSYLVEEARAPPPGTTQFFPRLGMVGVWCKGGGMVLVEGVQVAGRLRMSAVDAWAAWGDQGRVGLGETVQLGWWGKEDEGKARRGSLGDEEDGEGWH